MDHKKKLKHKETIRCEFFRGNLNPGPGTYNIEAKNKGPFFSVKGKRILKTDNFPGPGSYNSPKSATGKMWKIGKGKRHEICLNFDQPGPGYYESVSRSNTPSWSFRKSSVSNNGLLTPGPGNYESKKIHPGVSHSAPKEKKRPIFRIVKTPGPGQYENSGKPEIKSFTISKAKRTAEIPQTPGPGDYETSILKQTKQSNSSTLPTLSKSRLLFSKELKSSRPNTHSTDSATLQSLKADQNRFTRFKLFSNKINFKSTLNRSFKNLSQSLGLTYDKKQ